MAIIRDQSHEETDFLNQIQSQYRGNNIFFEDFHVEPSTRQENEIPRSIDSLYDGDSNRLEPYERLRDYRERFNVGSLGSGPEISRRYFTDLDETLTIPNPISNPVGLIPPPDSPGTSRFLLSPNRRTNQLERMDINVNLGKSSLFLTSHEADEIDVYGKAIVTDSGARLLLPICEETFLGEGRYSKVFKGSYRLKGQVLWKEVAVKLASKDTESHQALNHEISVLQQLGSPFIIQFFDTFNLRHDPQFEAGYIMEYAHFGTLESFLQAKDVFSLSLHQLISWSQQLCTAVKALKDAGITHFDVKPQNLLVMKDYSLRLGDFGESLTDLQPAFEKTRGRGTLSWTSPELLYFDSAGSCDGPAIDMYSTGLVIYSLVTGKYPWQDFRGPPTHLILSIKKGFIGSGLNELPPESQPYRLPGPSGETLGPEIVDGLCDLIKTCTALNPFERPTIDEVLVKLYDLNSRSE